MSAKKKRRIVKMVANDAINTSFAWALLVKAPVTSREYWIAYSSFQPELTKWFFGQRQARAWIATGGMKVTLEKGCV